MGRFYSKGLISVEHPRKPGVQVTLKDLAKETGIPYCSLYARSQIQKDTGERLIRPIAVTYNRRPARAP